MNPPPASLMPKELGRIFRYRLELDRACRMVAAGDCLKRFLPERFIGDSLWDHFSVLRPSVSQSPQSVIANQDLLFVLQSKAKPALKLRGQLVVPDEPSLGLLFLVSPWLTGLKELETLGLRVEDFAHVDPVVDFLFVIQSAQMALQDSKRLNAKLASQGEGLRRASQLTALRQAVDRVLVEQVPLEETLSQILRSLCENLSCDYAGYWCISENKRHLCHQTAFTNVPALKEFEETSRHFKFVKGEGLPGRVWESRRPETISDLATDGNFPRLSKAGPLRGAFAFPVVRNDRIEGVIECLSRDTRSDDSEFLGVCEDLGHRIGDYMERREQDEKYRSTTSQLMALIENLPAALLMEDEERRLIHANQEFCRMFCLDWSPQELGGTNCANLALAQREIFQDPPGFIVRMSQILSAKKAVKAEELTLASGGVIERDYIPIRIGETYKGHVWVYRDITEKKKNERLLTQAAEELLRSEKQAAENASRAKSQFLSTMSHEIRTPMNAVIGMTSLLIRTELDDRQMHFVKTIRNAGTTLLEIINDILDLSKIEAGKLELRKSVFSLREIVQTVVDLFEESARAKGLRLEASFTADVHHYVESDPDRLRQVLWNLVGNAIKFTESGKVSIRVAAMGTEGDCSTLLFEIEDTGIGMGPDAIAKLFTPFFQGDTSDRRKFYGTGLGLTITRQIVERMGGNIGVKSRLGEGSTFWFSVNLPIRQAPALRLVPVPKDRQASDATPISILLVEDNEINLEMAVAMLQTLGHTPETARNGREAVERTASHKFDLILMDCQMPEMDGFEATRLIRERESGGESHALIVALTAGVLREERERCTDAGMDDYLAKPITVEDLAKLIQRLRDKGAFLEKLTSATAETPPLIDEARLKTLKAIGPKGKRDLLSRMIDILTETGPVMIESIEKAVAGKDRAEMKAAAHKLKGAAANLGIKGVAEQCHAIEKAASDGDFEKAKTILQSMKRDLQASTRHLETHWREAA